MITQNTAIAAPQSLMAKLSEQGWVHHVAEGLEVEAVVSEISRIGDLLGKRAAGRAGGLEEVVRPPSVRRQRAHGAEQSGAGGEVLVDAGLGQHRRR
jgi:hypothetical protein